MSDVLILGHVGEAVGVKVPHAVQLPLKGRARRRGDVVALSTQWHTLDMEEVVAGDSAKYRSVLIDAVASVAMKVKTIE